MTFYHHNNLNKKPPFPAFSSASFLSYYSESVRAPATNPWHRLLASCSRPRLSVSLCPRAFFGCPRLKHSFVRMLSSDTPSDHFLRCWRQQFCNSCLDQSGCSWCPFVRILYNASLFSSLPSGRRQVIESACYLHHHYLYCFPDKEVAVDEETKD